MKIRPSVLWICAAAIIAVALAIWLSKRPAETRVLAPAETDIPIEPAERKSAAAAPDPAEIISTTRNNIAPTSPAPGAAPPAPVQSKAEQAREVLATLNDVPIVFYGKVQDQFSNPVARAEITGSIIYDSGASSGVREVKTVSDARGFFEFHAGNGESLSVVPRKEGYALASTNAGFKYSHFYPESRHVPEPSHPAIIEMWKLQGAEMLIHFEISTYVRLDGSPNSFDLQTGKRTESGGDIIVRVESAPVPNVVEKYDWKVIVQAVNGGVVPCSGVGFEKMFFAPASGYESEFVVSSQRDLQPWSSRFNGGFYFKTRNGGTYGKLGFAITTDVVKNESVPVTISGYLNPAGSRNLEVEPGRITEARP